MKNKALVGLLALLIGGSIATTSCEDMLTVDSDRYAYDWNGTDTVNFYLGIFYNLQGVIEQNHLLADLRSDLATTTTYTSDSISKLYNFTTLADGDNGLLNRSAYYKVINQCNYYLHYVDSMAMKNNVYYMRKELAQVEFIRAWTYMQLVQNYGTVPFFTDPVSTTDTGWETNPSAWATADNLLDLLYSNLMQAYAYQESYGYPDYGDFNTGSVTVAHDLMLFPGELVLGDLYLLRGASKSDYETAAQYFYDYLEDYGGSISTNNAATWSGGMSSFGANISSNYFISFTSWTSRLSNLSSSNYTTTTGEFITAVPSAANTTFGQVLTRIPEIYGYEIHSSNATTTTTNDDDEDETTTSGEVTISPNYEYRQIAISEGYQAIASAQDYVMSTLNTDETEYEVEYPSDLGDARIYGTAPYYETDDEGRLRFIQKYGAAGIASSDEIRGSFNFRYIIPIYRLAQVWLRYAEAINRAGYPRYAYAVLRDGMNYNYLPDDPSVTRTAVDTIYDINAAGDTINTSYSYAYSFTDIDNRIDGLAGIDYISVAEQIRAQELASSYIDFSTSDWANDGIHELGCGTTCLADTLKSYARVVLARIQEEASRTDSSSIDDYSLAVSRLTAEVNGESVSQFKSSVSTANADTLLKAAYPSNMTMLADYMCEPTQAEINAVETLIADELALEMAFDGVRYYDLMRLARHKNADSSLGANYGSSWMAWLISRRNLSLDYYESPEEKGDEDLYSTLQSGNWYLQSPEY